MRPGHWPQSAMLIAFLATGCAFPGRQQANNNSQQSGWGPFNKPDVSYAEGDSVEEDDFPTKEITDPNPLKLQYARWMEETGNVADAQKHYSDVLASQPKNVEALLGLARIDLAQGRTDAAEQSFQRVLKLDRDHPLAHSGLGQCLASRKEWNSAAEELTKANRALPEDKTIRYQLAVALVHTGDLAAAQLQFADCVGEAAGHYNTALILKDEGKLGEAEAQLELALRKDPKLKDAQRWLVEIRRARNQVGQISAPNATEAIHPPVKQVTYQNFGPIGSVEIEPAVYVPEEDAASAPADGHSTSR